MRNESADKAIPMVFTGYCPHEHLLEWLGQAATKFGPVFREIFPTYSRKGGAIRNRICIGAHYGKNFMVFWGDIEYLVP
jgi:hypothetical protein